MSIKRLCWFWALALALPVRATEVRGRVALGFTSTYFSGTDPTLRLYGRLRLELTELFGTHGSLRLDLEGRRSDSGLSRDPIGLRELRIDYELLDKRVAVQLGRLSLAELEGLQIDGASLRFGLGKGLTLQVAGGVRPDLATPDGRPDSGRPGFGALLRAEGKTASAVLGLAELRSDGRMERRIVSGSAYARIGEGLSFGGHGGIDLGQAGEAVRLTSLFANATFRQGRRFDLGASLGLSSPIFLDPRTDETAIVDLPEELQPQPLAPELRFGPQSTSLTLRGQVSPISLLSVYGAARIARREDEISGTSAFTVGSRLRLSQADRTRLRVELTRALRPGLDGTDLELWRWKAVGTRRLGALELEAGVGQTLNEPLEAEATMTWLLNRHLSVFSYYSLDPGAAGDLHVLTGQLAYRF